VTAAVVMRTRPVARCPRDGAPLDDGPVSFLCPACRRGVMAAEALRSAPTHVLTVTSKSGKRVSPLRYGPPSGFCACYGQVDLDARLARAAKDPDLSVSVRVMKP
jgi:hypothetical protein